MIGCDTAVSIRPARVGGRLFWAMRRQSIADARAAYSQKAHPGGGGLRRAPRRQAVGHVPQRRLHPRVAAVVGDHPRAEARDVVEGSAVPDAVGEDELRAVGDPQPVPRQQPLVELGLVAY